MHDLPDDFRASKMVPIELPDCCLSYENAFSCPFWKFLFWKSSTTVQYILYATRFAVYPDCRRGVGRNYQSCMLVAKN